MAAIDVALGRVGFGKPHFVRGRESIADLFKPNKRCGIYVLCFASGEYYVGKAVDITRRYVQHRRNHSDIESICFLEVNGYELDRAEREAIEIFERCGLLLRNISLVSIPKGESDFELIMSRKLQGDWLTDLEMVDLEGERPLDLDLRRKYQRKYLRLQEEEGFREVLTALRGYVRKGIPAIRRGEISFWSCSCLPPSTRLDHLIYARINIYWQEVLTIWNEYGKLGFSFHLCRSVLEHIYGRSFLRFNNLHPSSRIFEHAYVPGGPDQANIQGYGVDAMQSMLSDRHVLRAIRLFNLRLMNKGPCVYGRYHCLDLADSLIE